MANITVTYKGLTGLHRDIVIDNAQTLTQLRTAIIADEGLTAGYYGVVSLKDSATNSTDDGASTLAALGMVTGSIVLCSTAAQADKEAKQTMRLDIAQLKRAGGVAADTSAAYYRSLDTYDKSLLPTQYSGDSVTDNANVGGLQASRPWT